MIVVETCGDMFQVYIQVHELITDNRLLCYVSRNLY